MDKQTRAELHNLQQAIRSIGGLFASIVDDRIVLKLYMPHKLCVFTIGGSFVTALRMAWDIRDNYDAYRQYAKESVYTLRPKAPTPFFVALPPEIKGLHS